MDIIFLSYSCQKSPSIRKKIYLKFKYHSGKIFHKNLYWKKKTINSSLYSKNWNILRCSRRISYFSKRKLKLATCFRRKKKWKKNPTPLFHALDTFFFFFLGPWKNSLRTLYTVLLLLRSLFFPVFTWSCLTSSDVSLQVLTATLSLEM